LKEFNYNLIDYIRLISVSYLDKEATQRRIECRYNVAKVCKTWAATAACIYP